MAELKSQLLEVLSEARFVASGLRSKQVSYMGRSQDGSDGVLLALRQGAESMPCPKELVSALLCAALFPQVATATAPKNKKPQKGDGSQEKPKIRIRDAETGEPVEVKLHPSSVSVNEKHYSSPYFVYQELVNTTRLYIRDVTPVPPLALVLFGGSLSTDAAAQLQLSKKDMLENAVLTID